MNPREALFVSQDVLSWAPYLVSEKTNRRRKRHTWTQSEPRDSVTRRRSFGTDQCQWTPL